MNWNSPLAPDELYDNGFHPDSHAGILRIHAADHPCSRYWMIARVTHARGWALEQALRATRTWQTNRQA